MPIDCPKQLSVEMFSVNSAIKKTNLCILLYPGLLLRAKCNGEKVLFCLQIIDATDLKFGSCCFRHVKGRFFLFLHSIFICMVGVQFSLAISDHQIR